MTPSNHDRAAEALRTAEAGCTPIPPLVETFPDIGVADAYAIQHANIERRISGGAVLVGYKVGLTARAMQELLGVDVPDYGHLLDAMVHDDGAALAATRFIAPRVEPEIAFVLAAPLRGPGVTVDDVLGATRAVVPSLEIADSRIADWRIAQADTIADNASGAAVVFGAEVPLDHVPSLPTVAVELLVNGEVAGTGSGAAVLGDPALAVAWLADTLGAAGSGLEAGQLVIPGSCTPAPLVKAGDRVEARFAGLGEVTATFT